MGELCAKGLSPSRVCHQPANRTVGAAGHKNRGTDRFLRPHRTAAGGGYLLRRTGFRRLRIRSRPDTFGAETSHPHRQLRGRFCAADIGETRGRCIGGDCHKARRGNAKTRPRTPQSAIPTRRNPGVRALPRPLSHHRRHCLSSRRIPQGLGQENVCVQSDGGGGGGDSDNFVEKRAITVSS